MSCISYNSKPKRPMSAYMLWLNSMRQQLKAENPGLKVTELARLGGQIWRSMKDKSEWEEKAAKASEQYANDLKAYYNDADYNSGSRSFTKHYRFWMKSHGFYNDDETDEDHPISRKRSLNSVYVPETVEEIQIKTEPVPETVEEIQIKTEPLVCINKSLISNSNIHNDVSKPIAGEQRKITITGFTECSNTDTITSNATQRRMQNKEEAADFHFGRMLHYLMEMPDGKEKVMKYVNILNAICKDN